MRPVQKLFLLGLLFSVLSFLPISVSESDTKFDLENKASPRLNSITSSIVDDFLVNDDTGSANQGYPIIAVDDSGNFIITWEDYRNALYYNSRWYNIDIYAQRYNSSAIPLGSNFKVSESFDSANHESPFVAMGSSGDFVLVWEDDRNSSFDFDIYAQRYNFLGALIGANFKVNDYTGTASFGHPVVAMDGFKNFVITWKDYRRGFPESDIYAQRYDSAGTSLDSNFRVNDNAGYWEFPAIAMDGSGSLVIAWDDVYHIYAQRYDSVGIPLGLNFEVNDDTGATYKFLPAIAADDSGNFVLAWEDWRSEHSEIYAQRFSSSGSPLGPNFKVNDDTAIVWQHYPTVALDGSGEFVIAWRDLRNYNADVYAQRYDRLGNPIGSNYLVPDPQYSSFAQQHPKVAVSDSKIYFTWMDDRRKKGWNSWDIYAKVVDWNWGTPHMVLNPGILNFIATQNGALPQSQTFIIYNSNGGTFSWNLSYRATWLDVSPDSGSGDSTIITVNVNRTDSLPFTSYDTIVVSSPDADNSPQMIPVNYYLSPPPSGPDPGIPDTVSVERIANVPPNTHLPPVHVYMTNDEPLAAYMIPLAFPDSIYDYDIICDSISFAGTRTGPQSLGLYPVVDNNRNILFIPVLLFASQLDQGNGPIAKIYFSTGPNWKAEYSVPINSIIWPGGLGVPPGIGLQCVDSSGQAWTPVFKAGALQVKESEPGTIPSHFELSQNYPNPFNPFTTIPFQVGSSRFVVHSPLHTTLKIYNILGQLVRTLVDEEKAPGKYEVI